MGKLGFKVGAEIGVAQGWYSELLCQKIPGLKLYAVDVWEPYHGYPEYKGKIENYYEQAKKRFKPFDVVEMKMFSMEAVLAFEDNSLDFVFIDGAHDFKNVAMDIVEWSKKVKPGGIVFGHDYRRSKGPMRHFYHVKDVVQAYMYSHEISPWFVLANDVRDSIWKNDVACWMFVRQEGDNL